MTQASRETHAKSSGHFLDELRAAFAARADQDAVCFKDRSLRSELPELDAVLPDAQPAGARADAHSEPAVSRDAPCLMLYSSGTTGLPKGVVHTHALEERLGWPVINRYGMCEAHVITSLPLDGPWPQGSVGLPLEGIEVRGKGLAARATRSARRHLRTI
jgi:acyl-coenzyme A synthetase/AMP-(fatty) acid ligase